MPNWRNGLFNATIAANCLLCFLLIFYDGLVVPSLLQVFGRAHPLFLHFPIVLFALFIAWIWIFPHEQFQDKVVFIQIGKWLLLSTAFTATATAIMGIFLSKEPGYSQDSLQLHKWSGTIVALLSFAWYIFYDRIDRRKIYLAFCSIAGTIILILAGHQGASITHGDNFLLAPVATEKIKKQVALADALVFEDMVKPILDAKCLNCHNNKKAKGELIMETQQLLLKGGKNGALWDTTDVNLSLMLQRIHLPEEEKKHMPPAGKPQLTEREELILYNWIKEGANFTSKVKDLLPSDTLHNIAGIMFNSDGIEEQYDFSAASESTIQILNTNYRVVYPIAKESPAIAVDFFGASFFNADQLKDLLKIKTQLVSLNLDKMPVTDNELQTIGQFLNLRSLNISFSKISGNGLKALSKLDHLKRISLTNTSIRKEDLRQLASLKEIHRIYIWNSGISLGDLEAIRKDYPDLDIQSGMRTDTMYAKLNPPIVQNEAEIVDTPVKLKLKHYVPGITIRYTLDGSLPDSLLSPVYDTLTKIDKQELMKARAFKSGWHASEVVQYQFYTATFKPDTIILLKPTDSSYRAKGGKTLHDLEKGSLGFGDGKWLAFRKNNLECILVFAKPVNAHSVTVSSLVNVGALVFPPKSVEIWGGNDRNNLKLLSHLVPAQDTVAANSYLIPYECRFNQTKLKYIKVIVVPLPKVPKKFASPKNDTGWFFTDELFVN